LLAYMVFVPFCEMGSIDGPSLQASNYCQSILELT